MTQENIGQNSWNLINNDMSLDEMKTEVEAMGFVFTKLPKEQGGELWCTGGPTEFCIHGDPVTVINEAFNHITYLTQT